jgi:hypothetical protein
MNSTDAIEIFNTMTSENIVYVFHGDFNYGVINTLLSDIKKELHKSASDMRTAKKTYKVLVECLENVHKHAVRKDNVAQENNEGIFILKKNGDAYVVAIGNSILIEDVKVLKEHLDEINDLDPEGLKKKYRETLLTTEVSQKGGAGMGMIDIALKSGSILDYSFSEYTESKQFFSLKVLVQA